MLSGSVTSEADGNRSWRSEAGRWTGGVTWWRLNEPKCHAARQRSWYAGSSHMAQFVRLMMIDHAWRGSADLVS